MRIQTFHIRLQRAGSGRAAIGRLALLLWLACSLVIVSAEAQVTRPRPTPIPPPPGGSGVQLSDDDSGIAPQVEQTFAGGQPIVLERGVKTDDLKSPVATCVGIRLDPPPNTVDFTLGGTITPKQQSSSCATGEVLTCKRNETGDCGKFTIAIDSRPATPPRDYSFNVIARCNICTPAEKQLQNVQFTIAKPSVEVKALTSAPSPPVVTAGGAVIYTLEVQRKSYLGPIDILPVVENDPLGGVRVTQPSTIQPVNNPNRRHTVVVTATTQTGTTPGPYQIRVAPSLPPQIRDADLTAATVPLTVDGPPSQPSVTVSVQRLTNVVRRASCAQFEVVVQHANFPPQFNVPAILRLVPAQPFPAGFTAVFDPITVPINGSTGSASTKLLIGVPPAAAQMRYDFEVEAEVSVGPLTITGSAITALGVDDVPPLVTVTPMPKSFTVNRGVSFVFALILDRGAVNNCSPGFTGNVKLGVTGSFGGIDAAISPQPGTGNGSGLSVTVNPSAEEGEKIFTVGKGDVAGDYEVVDTPVTVNVPPPPQPPPSGGNLVVTPASLAFSGVAGGANPSAGALAIGSTGGVLSWTASDNAPWLTLSPATGATGGSTNVIVNVAGLAAGTYNAAITFAAGGSPNVVVPVTLTLSAPPPPAAGLVVSPASLAFSSPQGGPSPAPQVLSIASTGAVLAWTVSDNAAFVNATPSGGITPGTSNVSVNVAGLAAGSYNAVVTVSAPGVSSRTVSVSLTVTPPPGASLVVNPPSLSFTAPQGGPAPAVQVLSIDSTGAPLNWTVSDNAAFVNATPTGGTTPGAANVSVNVGGLSAGSYSATITVSAPGAAPRNVPVSLTVTAVGAGTPIVNGFNPVSGGTNTQVEVIGANFVGVSQVTFNGAVASFTPIDSGRLTAMVPGNATTGPIRVTNASGTGASFTPFTVTSGGAPSIALFSPPSGRTGDRITIQGANFRDPSEVFFNGVRSPFVLFGGPNFLSAEVPAGATTGPIRVTTSAGSATSAQSFVVTQ